MCCVELKRDFRFNVYDFINFVENQVIVYIKFTSIFLDLASLDAPWQLTFQKFNLKLAQNSTPFHNPPPPLLSLQNNHCLPLHFFYPPPHHPPIAYLVYLIPEVVFLIFARSLGDHKIISYRAQFSGKSDLPKFIRNLQIFPYFGTNDPPYFLRILKFCLIISPYFLCHLLIISGY